MAFGCLRGVLLLAVGPGDRKASLASWTGRGIAVGVSCCLGLQLSHRPKSHVHTMEKRLVMVAYDSRR